MRWFKKPIPVILVCFVLIMLYWVFSQVVSKGTAAGGYKSASKKLFQDKNAQNEKPLAVEEWEKVWGDIWNGEAKELKERGISEEQIAIRFNRLAAERVSKNLNMNRAKVEKIVSDYYTALKKMPRVKAQFK